LTQNPGIGKALGKRENDSSRLASFSSSSSGCAGAGHENTLELCEGSGLTGSSHGFGFEDKSRPARDRFPETKAKSKSVQKVIESHEEEGTITYVDAES